MVQESQQPPVDVYNELLRLCGERKDTDLVFKVGGAAMAPCAAIKAVVFGGLVSVQHMASCNGCAMSLVR